MHRIILAILCATAFFPQIAQAICTDDVASNYHDCLIGCGVRGDPSYYSCTQSCDETTDFAECVNDGAGREGGLHYHALLRGVVESCNCPQGQLGKNAKAKCVERSGALLAALGSLKAFGLIDPTLVSSSKRVLKATVKQCK